MKGTCWVLWGFILLTALPGSWAAEPAASPYSDFVASLTRLQTSLRAAEPQAPRGAVRDLVKQATQAVGSALGALRDNDAAVAYRQTLEARDSTLAARVALSAKEPASSLLGELARLGEDLVALCSDLGTTVIATRVWTPSAVVSGEEWTGLVVAQTPTGYRPYTGDLQVNGRVTPVEQGVVPCPPLTGDQPGFVFFERPGAPARERSISPPIQILGPALAAAPALYSSSPLLHPRSPVLTVGRQGLGSLAQVRLTDAAGAVTELPWGAGSSVERLYFPPPLPPGDYRVTGTTAAGDTLEAPTTLVVPKLGLEVPPITHVGQTGVVTVTSTAELPLLVELTGGKPQIELAHPVVEVSQPLPGRVAFVARQVGTYSLILRPLSPEEPYHQAVPPTPEQDKLWPIVGPGLPDFLPLLAGAAEEVKDAKAQARDQADKEAKEAEKLQKEAETLEAEADQALADDDETGAERKYRAAADKRKQAGDKYSQAANDLEKGCDKSGAAGYDEKAAANYRKEGEDREMGGGTKNDGLKRAAAAEQRAAIRHSRAASEKGKAGDWNGAAAECDQAAQNYGRAADDYEQAGAGSAAKRMGENAQAMSRTADALRKKAG